MMPKLKTSEYLKQLQATYPQAFKWNYLFYGQLKTKGILDEAKEFIPFILALMIFTPISMGLAEIITLYLPQFDSFQAQGISILTIMLFLMMVTPLIIKQIKHSSSSLYAFLHNTPIKITALILLQALNLLFIESWIMQGVLFFFALIYGFVKFYKENMFRPNVTHGQYYELQQVRRACFWAYKQVRKYSLKKQMTRKNSNEYLQYTQQQEKFIQLHLELFQLENKLCMKHKHLDMEKYLDSLM
ncbi:hypothetical protein G9F32_06790 [Acinetobacter sp. 194]|nr:hypothetical protein [Acinetobacter shaoyimingii]